MFAADYPLESAEEAGHWMDSEKIDEKVRDGHRLQQRREAYFRL